MLFLTYQFYSLYRENIENNVKPRTQWLNKRTLRRLKTSDSRSLILISKTVPLKTFSSECSTWNNFVNDFLKKRT